MTPAVSVIVPTWERRESVLRAVRSVLAQTFEDFELIVVDDGSTDGTAEALAGLDPRIRYEWQENGGPASARNAGLRLAEGRIVAFLDSDNRWLPDHLDVVTKVFGRFPEAVLVSTCPGQHIAGRAKPQDARIVDALPLLLGDASIGLSSCVGVVRDELLAVGGFAESLPSHEDHEMYLRLATRGPFAFVQHRTIVHQITAGSRHALAMRGDGAMLALESISRLALELARTSDRPDREELVSRAEGRIAYIAALRALVEGHDAAARSSLEEACRLLPELSRSPELVGRRIAGISARGAGDRFSAAAALWPDQRSDTAVFLRLVAAAHAVRTGRLREAARLVARRPFAANPAFLVRTRSTYVRLLRRAIRHRRHRAAQSDAA